jgi:hypothetical protein
MDVWYTRGDWTGATRSSCSSASSLLLYEACQYSYQIILTNNQPYTDSFTAQCSPPPLPSTGCTRPRSASGSTALTREVRRHYQNILMEHTESISSVPVVNLVLPVGTLINIEGSALYEGSATVVLAVLELGELTFSTSFMLGITSPAYI